MLSFFNWAYINGAQTTPANYWNVKSSEERIRNIYFDLDDIFNYLEYLKDFYEDMDLDIEQIKEDIEKLLEISGADGIKDIVLDPKLPKFNVTYHNETSKSIDFVGNGIEITSDGNSITFNVDKQDSGVTPEQLDTVKLALEGKITNESNRAIAAEELISKSVNDLSDSIEQEIVRATIAEGELSKKITDNAEEAKLDVLAVAKDLSDEITRAKETEEMKLSKTPEIQSVAFYITEEEAMTAPKGTLAFYPEVVTNASIDE